MVPPKFKIRKILSSQRVNGTTGLVSTKLSKVVKLWTHLENFQSRFSSLKNGYHNKLSFSTIKYDYLVFYLIIFPKIMQESFLNF